MEGEAYRPLGRRTFLGILGLGATGVLVGAPIQTALESLFRPLAQADGTGLTALLPTTAKFRFYSVAGFNPDVARDDYRLSVAGLVDTPLELSFDDLLERPMVGLTRDFQCVTGWRVPDVEWAGVRVADLLDEAGVDDRGTHLRFFSADGVYTTTLSLDQARRDDVIVATKMLGDDVTREHGGPVRLYVAPMYGYKSVKWLTGLDVVDSADPPGFWETRGYATDAWVGESNGRSDQPT
ncbi:MAG: molybdopterin-dependent oxidoreductase [Acidimicrobiales bacterium]|nr:molybdopterin-dependent oxidoreductase [Acidimicrobiales bacterium]